VRTLNEKKRTFAYGEGGGGEGPHPHTWRQACLEEEGDGQRSGNSGRKKFKKNAKKGRGDVFWFRCDRKKIVTYWFISYLDVTADINPGVPPKSPEEKRNGSGA